MKHCQHGLRLLAPRSGARVLGMLPGTAGARGRLHARQGTGRRRTCGIASVAGAAGPVRVSGGAVGPLALAAGARSGGAVGAARHRTGAASGTGPVPAGTAGPARTRGAGRMLVAHSGLLPGRDPVPAVCGRSDPGLGRVLGGVLRACGARQSSGRGVRLARGARGSGPGFGEPPENLHSSVPRPSRRGGGASVHWGRAAQATRNPQQEAQ